MAKKFDDVIMPERRRSIRDIPIPEGRRKTESTSAPRKVSTDNINILKKPVSAYSTPPIIDRITPPPTPPSFNNSYIPPTPPARPTPPSRPKSGKKRVWLAGFVGLVILAVTALSFFDGATLTYTPKSQALTFAADTLTVKKVVNSGLFFSVVKLSGDKSMAVNATGESQVSRKASGAIVVYNEEVAAQPLVENTRFESPAGKVYRIAKAITVPGKSGSVPGSVEATVFADQPGESYNSAATDFTLPGLKGNSKYKTVYARSKGAISGGFVGTEKGVSAEDLAKAQTELKSAISNDLIAKAQAEVPKDVILFPSLTSITFEEQPQTAGEGGKANVNMKGNLVGIMFKRTDLAFALAKNKVGLKADEAVEIPKLDTLEVSFAGTPPTDLLSANEINIKVSGPATLLWLTDEVALKSDLVGRHKSDLEAILRNYPTIASANTTIRPFWKRTLPKAPGKIIIKKVNIE